MTTTISGPRVYEDEVIWWCRNASTSGYIAEIPFVDGFFLVEFDMFYTGKNVFSHITHGPFESVEAAAAAIVFLGGL